MAFPSLHPADRVHRAVLHVGFMKGGIKTGTLYKGADGTVTPSPELAYVWGVVLGDGWLSYVKRLGAYRIGLTAEDREFVEEFARCMTKVLVRKRPYQVWKAEERRGTSFYRAVGMSKVLFRLFKHASFDLLRRYVERFPTRFLRGLFDSEGSVEFGGGVIRVRLYNSSREVIDLARGLLIQLDYDPKVYRGHKAYLLELHRKADVVRFKHEIGFTIKRKQARLEGGYESHNSRVAVSSLHNNHRFRRAV